MSIASKLTMAGVFAATLIAAPAGVAIAGPVGFATPAVSAPSIGLENVHYRPCYRRCHWGWHCHRWTSHHPHYPAVYVTPTYYSYGWCRPGLLGGLAGLLL
jgi:hypothetical protein